MTEVADGRPLALVSGTSSDSHMWNLVYLQLLLEEIGFTVVNLGACVPDPVLVTACLRHRPALTVLSSVNGHGCVDAARAVAAMRARPALATMPVVVGGSLGVTGGDTEAHAAMLERAGADATFEGPGAVEAFRRFVAGLATGRRQLAGEAR